MTAATSPSSPEISPGTAEWAAAPPALPACAPSDFATSGELSLPQFLSPSRASDFRNCPRRFFYSSVAKLSGAATQATTVGTLAHFALEHLFDLPAEGRCYDAVAHLVEQHWSEICSDSRYLAVASLPTRDIDAMLATARTMVANYFLIENPAALSPVATEQRLYAIVNGVPTVGVIDRMDRARYSSGALRLVISDYKTGKVPKRRYVADKFFAMRLYGALVEEVTGERAFHLRLVYVAAASRDGVFKEVYDDAADAKIRALWADTWQSIVSNAESGLWEPRTNPLCDWCDHKEYCPAFSPLGAGSAPEPVSVPNPVARQAASYDSSVFDLD